MIEAILLSPWFVVALLGVAAIGNLADAFHSKDKPKWPAVILVICTCMTGIQGLVKEIRSSIKDRQMDALADKRDAKIDGIYRWTKETNLREWASMTQPQSSQNATSEKRVHSLIANDFRSERMNLPAEISSLEQRVLQEPVLGNQIALANAYLQERRTGLAREQFEIIAMGQYDSSSKQLGELLGRTLRAGYGDRLAAREIQPAWIVQWDQILPAGTEVSAKALVRTYSDPEHWREVPLAEPAGSVVPVDFSAIRSLQAKINLKTSNPIAAPEVRSKSMNIRLAVVDKSWKIIDPALLGRPNFIGAGDVDRNN